jgi:hypothetical protein
MVSTARDELHWCRPTSSNYGKRISGRYLKKPIKEGT